MWDTFIFHLHSSFARIMARISIMMGWGEAWAKIHAEAVEKELISIMMAAEEGDMSVEEAKKGVDEMMSDPLLHSILPPGATMVWWWSRDHSGKDRPHVRVRLKEILLDG